jgi:2-methylfumaryl-CoA hydratase
VTNVSKNDPGRFFEDFGVGQVLRHATPRTVSEADQTLYIALTGSRFALHSSDVFARGLGLPRAPLDDLLVFHLVFGRSVADVSLNAVANLGYADCTFRTPVYPGDTLTAESRVLGLRETASGKTGVVWLRSTGTNQRGETVLDYVRWVMVDKRDPAAPAPEPVTPELPEVVAAARLTLPNELSLAGYDAELAGSADFYDDYELGERIDHLAGTTLEEAEHQMATRLYQNNARVHFNLHAARNSRFGKRVVYGGHIISLARALSFNGLANAFRIAAINGGRHSNPSFAGDTIYAWSEVLEKIDLPDRADVGALRLRTIAAKDRSCAEFPLNGPDGKPDPAVVLDLDYTVLMPRR